MRFSILLLLSFTIYLTFFLFSASAQKIVSFTTNRSAYSPGDAVYLKASIENGEDILVDHKLQFMIMKTSAWEYVSIPGDTIIYETDSPLNLQPNEVKNIDFQWVIPTTAEQGIYRAYCKIISQNGVSKGFMTELFEVKNSGQQVKAVKLSDLEFEYKGEFGTALEGFHVDPNSKMSAQFMINNTGNVVLDLKTIINFTYTYNPDKSALSEEKSLTLKPLETKKIIFNLTSPSKPTTYTPVISAWSENNMLGELIGRLVVEGQGGTILNAHTEKLAYVKDEPVVIAVQVTGSADYEHEVKQADLYCKISDSTGREILSTKKTADLEFNPKEIIFSKSAPESFVNYTLYCSLNKGNKVLDEFKSNYIGGVLPMQPVKKESEWYWVMFILPIVFTIILIFYIYKRREHE